MAKLMRNIYLMIAIIWSFSSSSLHLNHNSPTEVNSSSETWDQEKNVASRSNDGIPAPSSSAASLSVELGSLGKSLQLAVIRLPE